MRCLECGREVDGRTRFLFVTEQTSRCTRGMVKRSGGNKTRGGPGQRPVPDTPTPFPRPCRHIRVTTTVAVKEGGTETQTPETVGLVCNVAIVQHEGVLQTRWEWRVGLPCLQI